MVATGFSRIHVAKYSAANGEITYTQCRELARARSMEISVDSVDSNDYYANNVLAESEGAVFSKGTATIVVDGLTAEEEAFILGIPIPESDEGDVEFGDAVNPPYLGIAGVKEYKLDGVVSYRPILLKKGRFSIPNDSVSTREASTAWQDQTLEATIGRDDSAKHNWKSIPKKNFPTEDAAVEWIRTKLGGVVNPA